MRGVTENMIGVLAGVVIAGVFLAVAYQLLTGFGVEQQKKQAMSSLNELASGVDYACGAGEGSSFTRTLNLPLVVNEIRAGNNEVCLVMESGHCINTNCPVSMEPLYLNSSFFRTKARVSEDNVIGVEFVMIREGSGVEISSQTVS